MARLTAFATNARRSIGAPQANRIVSRTRVQHALQFGVAHVRECRLGAASHTNIGVTAAIPTARSTFAVIPRIANVQGPTAIALRPDRIVMATQANVEPIGSLAVRMAIALALNAAIGADISASKSVS